MADIKTRAGEGRPLTNNEVDANFTNLNTDKAENGANTDITSLAGITGGVSTADYVDFDTLASGVARATGRLTWNDTDGCLEVGLKGSDVTQQIGQEMVTRVYNADSTTIANGEVVYFWSTAGEVIAGKKYIANATIDPHLIVGLATEDIAAGSYGYVTEFGFVRSLDTAAYNPGDILFCSPSVAGAIQSNEPSTPNDVVRVGICLESDSTNGIVLVNPHDVPRADEIRYDNADSGLSSTNVKSAIDELELVKADIALLTSNVTFYLTSANDSVLAGYKQLVTSTLDTNYDEIAFDYLTSSISNTATMLQAWVSDVNVLVGDIAGIVVPIVGNIRKDTGSGDARFYFEVYIRESDGTETLVTTSNVSDYITSTIYGQISLSATVSLQTFTDTDRVVIKLYGQTDASTAAYELQLGGSSPFRSLFPVPVSVVPSVANAYAIVADTTNFNGKLSSTDNNVQEALETLDDHVHQASEITGLTASNTTTNTSVFNGHLSVADTDIQKALNTLDDVGLQGITDVGATTTTAVTINAALDVDDLKLDGDTISNDGAAVDGNIVLSPKGAGEVDISKVDIDSGAIDGTTIGGTTPGAGTFTDLTVNTTATFAGATIADLGTVTTADIDGGTIDGVTLDATIADIDNIRIDGNSIISTDGNGNIDLTPNGLGEVNISKVDIAAGEIDGTTIGANSAAAGNFTALDVSTSASFAGASIDDLGTVATADINGGTIDGADITVGTGKTLSVINGTLTLADNQISGDKVHGGIISNFTSTGIDDNATSTAITIDSSQNVGIGPGGASTELLVVADEDTTLLAGTHASYLHKARIRIRNNSTTVGTSAGLTLNTAAGSNNYWHIDAVGATAYGSPLTFSNRTGSGSTETRMTITSNGYVGINETDPNRTLVVKSGDTVSQRWSNTSANNFVEMGTTAGSIRFGTQSGDFLLLTGGDSAYAGESTALTVKSSGNVGIGTSSPSSKLEVSGKTIVGSDSSNALEVFSSGDTEIAFSYSSKGNIYGKIIGDITTASPLGGDIAFQTATGGTLSERMRIDSSGSVGIGTSSPNANAKFEVVSTNAGAVTNVIQLRNGDATAGSGAKLQFLNSTVNYATAGTSEITGVRYSGNYSALTFTTYGPTSLVERMRIDGSGRVGIGTTSPERELEIARTGGARLRLTRDDTTVISGNPIGSIEFCHKDADDEGIAAQISSEGEGSAGGANLLFSTGTPSALVEAAVITSDGNVGIGTTSPAYKLDIYGSSTTNIDLLHLLNSNNTLGCSSSIMFENYSGGGLNQGRIKYLNAGSNNSNSFVFEQEINATNGLVETMRIDSSGNVLVGCTSAMGGGGSDGINGFGVQGSGGGRFVAIQNTTDANMYIAKNSGYTSSNFIFFYAAGTKVGSIYTNGTTTTYATSSDKRLKENIVDAPAGNIDAIRVRSFDWKADGSHQTYGMVAQELVDVVPEAVAQGETEDDMWGVDYSKLVPMMIKEIQDLKAEVAALKGV